MRLILYSYNVIEDELCEPPTFLSSTDSEDPHGVLPS